MKEEEIKDANPAKYQVVAQTLDSQHVVAAIFEALSEEMAITLFKRKFPNTGKVYAIREDKDFDPEEHFFMPQEWLKDRKIPGER